MRITFTESGRANLSGYQCALLERVAKEAPGFAFVVHSMALDSRPHG